MFLARRATPPPEHPRAPSRLLRTRRAGVREVRPAYGENYKSKSEFESPVRLGLQTLPGNGGETCANFAPALGGFQVSPASYACDATACTGRAIDAPSWHPVHRLLARHNPTVSETVI